MTEQPFTDDEYAFLRHVRFGEMPPAVRPDERVALTETDPGGTSRSPRIRSAGTCRADNTRRAAGVATHGPSTIGDQKTGTPSRTSRQLGWKKSAGSIVPWPAPSR
ncbi:hypothetical protein NKG94_09635 [Micromonospora sp. M12]